MILSLATRAHPGALQLLVLIMVWRLYASVWPRAPFAIADSPGYLEVARDLQDLRLDALHDRTPGYPLLLLAIGSSETPTRGLFHLQLLLHMASVLLLAALLRRFGASRWAVIIFGVIAFLPPWVAPAALALTEGWTEFLLAAAVFGLTAWLEKGRRTGLFTASLGFAVAGLTRPAYAFLCVSLGIALLLMRTGAKALHRRLTVAAVSIAAASALFAGGLALYNSQRFHYAGLTPLLGFNLATRTVRVVERLPDEYAAVRPILLQARDRELTAPGTSHTGVMYIWKIRPELEAATGLDAAQLSQYMLRMNLRLIRAAPLEYLQEVSRAAATFWFPATPEIATFGMGAVQRAWGLLQFAVVGSFFVQVLLLAGTTILYAALPPLRESIQRQILLGSRGFLVAIAVFLVLIGHTAVISTALEVGSPRYRQPVDLSILFVAVAGFDRWFQLARATKGERPQPYGAPG